MSRVKSVPATGIVRINLWVPRAHIPTKWQGKRVSKCGAGDSLSQGAFIREVLAMLAEAGKDAKKKAPQEAEPERAQECA